MGYFDDLRTQIGLASINAVPFVSYVTTLEGRHFLNFWKASDIRFRDDREMILYRGAGNLSGLCRVTDVSQVFVHRVTASTAMDLQNKYPDLWDAIDAHVQQSIMAVEARG